MTEAKNSASLQGYPAGLGRRLGAMLYDTLLILALFFLTGFIWVSISGDVVTGLLFQLGKFLTKRHGLIPCHILYR